MHISSPTSKEYHPSNEVSKKEEETNSNSSFENVMKENDEKTQNTTHEVKKTDRELVDDIISLIKTGFTKEELEEIERLKEEILKKIKDEEENSSQNGVTEIKNLLDKLDKMVQEMKKEVLGVVIEEAEDKNKTSSKKDESTSNDESTSLNAGILQELKDKLSNLSDQMKDLEKLQKQKDNKATSQDELFLMEQLKNS